MALTEFEKQRLLTDALLYEGQQHWLHYRHIEQERNQFLGFFFTLLVAIVGFFVAVSSRIPSWPTVALGLTCMAAVFGMISLLILASVRKFGAALHAYDRDIARIRSSLFSIAGAGRSHLPWDHNTARTHSQPALLHRMFDPQFAAEAIVGTFATVSFGVQVFVAADSLLSESFSVAQRAFACALAASSAGVAIAAVRLGVKFGEPRPRRS
ncbi:hypothetical protein Daura_18890 [Dactylosporangium aurantiacum]|uniref:Uncharacterized protein n=1 Tax=Dactylosporangium aurantiacum TaxID=35754 RepID=A0A9Q9IS86_9ACTN|nr:hypothetical protein [Dactylosporangium aurantiacum]MDG6105760.1 hypothetical protein [Dactylosporangium aurantiacum]UWZ58048.1 hypothetical protein Daura_18890 [Dactylosporangium aurantiacum]